MNIENTLIFLVSIFELINSISESGHMYI